MRLHLGGGAPARQQRQQLALASPVLCVRRRSPRCQSISSVGSRGPRWYSPRAAAGGRDTQVGRVVVYRAGSRSPGGQAVEHRLRVAGARRPSRRPRRGVARLRPPRRPRRGARVAHQHRHVRRAADLLQLPVRAGRSASGPGKALAPAPGAGSRDGTRAQLAVARTWRLPLPCGIANHTRGATASGGRGGGWYCVLPHDEHTGDPLPGRCGRPSGFLTTAPSR